MEEVKIKKIDIENLKAVSSFTAMFDGKSAHVTGANGFGKSTVIRALTDRLRGLRPSIITKIGEKEGKTVMELTDGCRFEWEYNNQGKDSLNYFTPNDIKPVRRDVFKHICGQYFPNQFDINKFLTTTEPRKRLQMISELVNVDLTEIQTKYKAAFEIRKDAKKELKILEAQIKPMPEVQIFDGLNSDAEQIVVDDLESDIKDSKIAIEKERNSLNVQYAENKKYNDVKETENRLDYKKALDEWMKSEDAKEDEIEAFNKEQSNRSEYIIEMSDLLNSISEQCQNTFMYDFIDFTQASKFVDDTPQPQVLKEYIATQKPELTTLNLPDPMPSSDKLDEMKKNIELLESNYYHANIGLENKKAELIELNSSKQVYDMQLKQYKDYQKGIENQANLVADYEKDVFEIVDEIRAIIKATKLPDEFAIDLTNKNDILFRTSPDAEYLPITNETLASSAIFIAAFKLQANYLESFRVAHFDVSYLDFENRQKVLKEAINMNIQLITESPAHDESTKMLQYKITED